MSSSPSILPGEFFLLFLSPLQYEISNLPYKNIDCYRCYRRQREIDHNGIQQTKILRLYTPQYPISLPQEELSPSLPPRTILKIIRQIHQNFSDYVSMDVQGDGVQWAKNRKNSSINFLCSNGCTLISLQFLKDPQASSGMLHLKICQNNVDF